VQQPLLWVGKVQSYLGLPWRLCRQAQISEIILFLLCLQLEQQLRRLLSQQVAAVEAASAKQAAEAAQSLSGRLQASEGCGRRG